MGKSVAFVTNYYTEENLQSGGIKLNFLLTQELLKKGYVVDVYTRYLSGQKTSNVDNVYIIDGDKVSYAKEYFVTISDKACYPTDITYIHDHSCRHRFRALYNRVRQILYKVIYYKKHQERKKQDLKTKSTLQEIKKIIVSSNVLKNDFVLNYGVELDKIDIIPPIIQFNEVDFKKQFNKDVVFGLVALSFEHKGGYIVLRSFAKLIRKYKAVKIRIIYENFDKNLYLKFLVRILGLSKNIDFLCPLKNMDSFYDGIDCLIVPSMVETFGMITSESMNRKTPVIVSSRAGSADLIQNGVNGFIFDFEKNNISGLANSMETFLKLNESQKENISENAYLSCLKFKENYFVQKLIESIESISDSGRIQDAEV